MSSVFAVLQGLGVLAVLVGVAVLLPPGGALVVGGLLVVALATAAELIVTRRLSAPSDRRSGPNAAGVE